MSKLPEETIRLDRGAVAEQVVVRFAPSPNGELHLGHAYSALLAYDAARRAGGRFLLRIEDIDIGRCRRHFEAQIYDDLAWLGLEWERPVRRQSEHFATYRKAAAELEALGVLYPCFATRREIAEAARAKGRQMRDPDGALIYPGLYRDAPPGEIARRRANGEPYALRIDMARAIALARDRVGGHLSFKAFDASGREKEVCADPARWGDAVIARKDVPASYHLAVVVDDALQGVTHVIRGQDLLAATGIHRLLQILLDLPQPLYHHHRLITGENGRKLSKSHRDKSLRSLRQEGATPMDIRRLLGLPSP